MKIGKLAELGGVTVDTVRYYERRGLMPSPAREASGYRPYTTEDGRRLQSIRRAQALGFRLCDVAELLSLTANRSSDMAGVRRQAEQRVADVMLKIAELERIKLGLERLIEACPGQGRLEHCPIVAALSGDDPLSDASQ